MQDKNKKNTEISERISMLIEKLSLNPNIFAKALGYERTQTIYDILNCKSAPSYDFFYKFDNSEYSEKINLSWLISGKGNMIKEEIIASKSISYKESKDVIPLVNQSVAAGFGSADFSIEKSDVKAYYVIPKFKDRRIDFMIEVAGSSMYPKYNSGDVIACTIIRESKFIQWNKVHVIATKEQGLLVKRIREDGGNSLLAVSENPDYKPFNVPLVEVTGLALVVGVVRLE